MKLSFVYGSWACGPRPFDFSRLFEDPRGLTGSEISCFSFAKELALRGHEVKLFAPISSSSRLDWSGIRIFPISAWSDTRTGWTEDAVLSWNEPDNLRGVPAKSVRFVNQQLNDFTYCQPGFDSCVDIYSSPCSAHLSHMVGKYGNGHKWVVLPNGCDPTAYPIIDKVPGRVLYASSPDRGLHWLLQQWPLIKRRVPEANLRVFYNFDDWIQNLLPCEDPSHHPHVRECAYRAHYIREAFNRLKDSDVQHFKSISRLRMAEEMASALVLAYPCDTVTYTEGFSVTIMEACAAGAVPVITDVDALGSVYGGSVKTIVRSPVRDHLEEWTELVIRSLTESSFRKEATDNTKILAEKHSWPVLTDRLEKILHDAIATKVGK